jgi:hypothetical protein
LLGCLENGNGQSNAVTGAKNHARTLVLAARNEQTGETSLASANAILWPRGVDDRKRVSRPIPTRRCCRETMGLESYSTARGGLRENKLFAANSIKARTRTKLLDFRVETCPSEC